MNILLNSLFEKFLQTNLKLKIAILVIVNMFIIFMAYYFFLQGDIRNIRFISQSEDILKKQYVVLYKQSKIVSELRRRLKLLEAVYLYMTDERAIQ